MNPNQKKWLKRLRWTTVVVYVFISPHIPFAKQEPHGGLGSFLNVALSNADSYTCIGCHDGVLARNVTSPYKDMAAILQPLSPARYDDHQSNHPIGMDYATSFTRQRGALRPMGSLPPSVQLKDGKVGCISCHSSSSSLPAKLVRSIERSALCFACHNL